MLTFSSGTEELSVFRDGRAIIRGTIDEAAARSLYARYIGL
jgi:adenylyltransferase/sulfurtransferase